MTDKEEVCQLTIKKHPVVNSEQEEEIAELNDPQDDVEQYTRKNPLEIHGILESALIYFNKSCLKTSRGHKRCC